MGGHLIPAEYGLVAGVAALSFVVHGPWMSHSIISAREKFGVLFPNLYATAENSPELSKKDRDKYNYVQRGHQSCMEQNAAFLSLLIHAGLRHPRVASLGGIVYLVGRFLSFQRVVEHNLLDTAGSKGKLWSSLLRRGPVATTLGFYTLLLTNCKWVAEWLIGQASGSTTRAP